MEAVELFSGTELSGTAQERKDDRPMTPFELLQAAREKANHSPFQPTANETVLRTWFFGTPHDDYDLLSTALTELRLAVGMVRPYGIASAEEIRAVLAETISTIRARQAVTNSTEFKES